MENLSLNLNDKARMADFLSLWSGLASKDMKEKAEATIRAYDDGKDQDAAEMAKLVKEVAMEVFPARFALNRFFNEEGGLIELDKIEHSVRKSTAHLIERFRKNTGSKSISEMMANDDFDLAFHDEEKSEIENVRHHIREDYWKSHSKNLSKLVDEGKGLLESFQELMEQLRLIAEKLPTLLQEELYAKVSRFEDQFYFKALPVSQEILDQEMAYYREQEELPIISP